MENVKSVVGLSVCVEKQDDDSFKVGVVIHTDDENKNFMISLPAEKAMLLSKQLFQAAKAAESGDLSSNLHLN